ncbi:hypothetical protein [Streptomyces blattellae]|uniref:hypothetical protein n=1 Tax=Streptomyces blattellae TaxID=2569855 RepID=UPI0012B815CB|nr:hypothetical protein [Streptomyces blattellae]
MAIGSVGQEADPLFPAYDDGAEPLALGWPSGEPMAPPQVLERLESRFGLWVPKRSEGERLLAAGLSPDR